MLLREVSSFLNLWTCCYVSRFFLYLLSFLSSHISILKDGTRFKLLTWYLEDPVLKFSIPLQIWDESEDSSGHLLNRSYSIFPTTQKKENKVCSSVIFSLLFCSVKSASKISIDYHGNCIGPVEVTGMTDGKKLCIWPPYKLLTECWIWIRALAPQVIRVVLKGR